MHRNATSLIPESLLLGRGSGSIRASTGPAYLFKFTAGDTPQGMLFNAPQAGRGGFGGQSPLRMYIGDADASPRSGYAGFSVQTGATFNLVFHGDSITRPYHGTPSTYGTICDGYASKMARFLRTPKFNFANFGRDSMRLVLASDLTLDAGTIIAATVPSALYTLPTITGVFLGTNDTALDGQSAATLWTRLKLKCAQIKAAYPTGKVIVLPMLPRANNGALETVRLAYNTSMRGGDSSFDYMADFGLDATIAANAASSTNTTYYSDQVHLTDAAHLIVYSYVKTQVQAAMASLGVS